MNERLFQWRLRTEDDWQGMRNRFHKEWRDACDTMRNQRRCTSNYEWVGSFQTNDFYAAHGQRMVSERWPDYPDKEEAS